MTSGYRVKSLVLCKVTPVKTQMKESFVLSLGSGFGQRAWRAVAQSSLCKQRSSGWHSWMLKELADLAYGRGTVSAMTSVMSEAQTKGTTWIPELILQIMSQKSTLYKRSQAFCCNKKLIYWEIREEL